MKTIILAQSGYTGSSEYAEQIISNVTNGYQVFQENLDNLWKGTFNGGVYTALVDTGLFFAVIGILFFTLKLLREWLKDEFSYESMQLLIMAILICALLTNNGLLLKNLVFGCRDLSNLINKTFLERVYDSQKLTTAFQKISSSQVLKDQLSIEIRKCDSVVDPEERTQCLLEAVNYIEQLSETLNLPEKEQKMIQDLKQDPSGGSFDFLKNPITAGFEAVISVVLIGFGVGIQVIAEICWLLIGLLAPIPVSLSLLPGNFQPLIGWLVGFFTIGLFRLCYNAMVGFTAVLMGNSEWIGGLTLAFISAILAPILAAGLAAGAGMLLFNSLAQIGTSIIKKFLKK